MVMLLYDSNSGYNLPQTAPDVKMKNPRRTVPNAANFYLLLLQIAKLRLVIRFDSGTTDKHFTAAGKRAADRRISGKTGGRARLLSLILITAQAEKFEVLSEPVDLPSSEKVVLELVIPADEIVLFPTEESPVIDYREAEISIDIGAEPMDVVPCDAAEVIQPTDRMTELSATEEHSTIEPVDMLDVPSRLEPTPMLPITPEPTDVPVAAVEPQPMQEAASSHTPEPHVDPTAAPIMFTVTCRETRTSIAYSFMPVEGDPP